MLRELRTTERVCEFLESADALSPLQKMYIQEREQKNNKAQDYLLFRYLQKSNGVICQLLEIIHDDLQD